MLRRDRAPELFPRVAAEIGLDVGAFGSTVAAKTSGERLKADIEIGIRLKLAATPSVFVNGRRMKDFRPKALNAVIAQHPGRCAHHDH